MCVIIMQVNVKIKEPSEEEVLKEQKPSQVCKPSSLQISQRPKSKQITCGMLFPHSLCVFSLG